MIVRNANEELKDLEIKYKNEIIDNLYVTKIAIWNDGNTKLEESDFASSIPFEYADPKEGVVIQILHTGNPEDLRLVGKIKSGETIKNVSKTQSIFFKALNRTFTRIPTKRFFKLYIIIIVIMLSFLIGITFLSDKPQIFMTIIKEFVNSSTRSKVVVGC